MIPRLPTMGRLDGSEPRPALGRSWRGTDSPAASIAVQNIFSSRVCVLPSGAKRRKARPGASRCGAPRGGARPPLLGAPRAQARGSALPCPCGGSPLSGETSPFPRTPSAGAVSSLSAAGEKRRSGADGPWGPASRGSLARRSRPGMGREARRGRKGGPLSTSRNEAGRPGRGVPPGCRRAGHLLCRPSSACRPARLPRAFANLLRPGGQRAESPRKAGPPARKPRRPRRRRTGM